MYRLLSLERGKRKRSLELSLAGIYELEMLKKRHETLITRALNDCTSPRHPTHTSWSVMNLLQHQVGELRMDTNSRSVDLSSDAEDTQDSSGLCDQIDVLDSFGLSEISQWAPQLVHLTEGTKSTSNVSGELQAVVPRSLSALEGSCEDEFWSWRSAEDQTSAEDYSQAQRVETYILSLVQRCSVSLRCNKPRTSLGPETRGVVRQSSLSFKDSHYRPDRNKPSPSPERRTWAHHSLDPKPTFAGTSLDFPCAALDPSSSEAESSRHFKGYEPPRSATSDEQLVNGQYIPAQPCHAKTRATSNRPHISPQPDHSTKAPERVPVRSRAAQKKYPFTEEKVTSKKLGRKAFRAQSENSLLGQRVSERKYNTVERDTGRSVQPKTHRTPGVSSQRRWRSTLELSQDEFEPSTDQQIRRTRKPRPALSSCVHSQHSHQSQHAPLSLPEFVACESESSLSAAESPGSSSLSSDSDESGGLVWPQQLAPPSPPAGTSSQPKAFVKIKASHALKKKILRFRTGSLKVMTTV